MQTKNNPNIFAAGDIADIENYKLVKAGVYAVRQSNTLKINLERVLKNKKLIKFIPQKSYLSIIGITNNKALGNKYFFTMKGRALWKLKKYIDKKFIKKYTDFFIYNKNIILNKKSKEPSDYMMQCGGCGSKIPQTVLEKIFEKNFQEGSFDANEITGEKS